MERIVDIETRVSNLEQKLSFIVFPHEMKEDKDFEYTGGE
tara:strand:- start:4774 stop:4893 length:120 start_codon:yes stop_codon:yes gene_type:complete